MLRHSAITYSASLGMSETELSYRFWGIPHSAMVSVYIHLNAQMQAQGYRNAKGMGEKEVKVINPLASRCVECGKLIQSGSLCSVCSEIKELRVIVKEQDKKIALMQHGFVHINVKYPKPEEALPNAK